MPKEYGVNDPGVRKLLEARGTIPKATPAPKKPRTPKTKAQGGEGQPPPKKCPKRQLRRRPCSSRSKRRPSG
jgi:hypothetical protein